VCWAEGLGKFIAVGSNTGATAAVVLISNNGTSWTDVTGSQFATCTKLDSVAYSEYRGVLCAVSSNTTSDNIFRSTNGSTWNISAGRPIAASLALRSISRSESLDRFVAVGVISTHPAIYWSIDGLIWFPASSIQASGLVITLLSVCSGDAIRALVAVGSGAAGEKIMYSRDGDVWVHTVDYPEKSIFRDICWSEDLGMFLSVYADSPNGVMRSGWW
jgi:hypothetical protein